MLFSICTGGYLSAYIFAGQPQLPAHPTFTFLRSQDVIISDKDIYPLDYQNRIKWEICTLPPHQGPDGNVDMNNGSQCASPASFGKEIGIKEVCNFKISK